MTTKRIIYLDANRDVVPAGQATYVVETEVDSEERVISETWNRVVSTSPTTTSSSAGTGMLPLNSLVAGLVLLIGAVAAQLAGAGSIVGIVLLVLGVAAAVPGIVYWVRRIIGAISR